MGPNTEKMLIGSVNVARVFSVLASRETVKRVEDEDEDEEEEERGDIDEQEKQRSWPSI